jgi:uncharacterized protein (DUF1800 family)
MKICISAIGLWVAASLGTAAALGAPAIKLSPATVSVRAGAKPATQTFTVSETGVTHTAAYAWALTGAAGVTGSLGTIDTKGVYTPPAVPPVPDTVTVTVTDSANSLSATAAITVLDPVPAISSLSTYNINTGLAYTVDVIGSGFMPSYQVMLGTSNANSKFVSSTDIRITGTSTAAAGTKIAVTVVDPSSSGGGKTSNAETLNVLAPVAVTVSPNGRTIRCGTTLALTWHVANNSNQAVTWQVNGIAGGNSTVGTVTSVVSSSTTTVTYTAPADLPGATTPPPTAAAASAPTVPAVPVTITATSAADPTASAGLTVNLENPTPVISSLTPDPVNPGAATFTITGSGFAPGAIVYFAGGALDTTWISDTRLTAAGTVAIPFGGIAGVKVTNPNPGSLTSTPVAVPVQLPAASVKMAYSDAVRFLQKASWGPTPASIAELQTMGVENWLTAQFAMPASTWPDPYNDNEGMTRLQTAFFDIAMTGQDQLRQRVSFALAQILVSSGAKDTEFSQMVSYQRLLGNDAFGSFRTLIGDMTLNPAMGFYLDMVNNAKANPKLDTVANENYARESMQLFTVGLVQLNSSGMPIAGAAPEYTQATVTDMAKIWTGWTYAPAPGYATEWPNQPYYFAPMVPFESQHDTTAKTVSLPNPCSIPAGGTAESDMNTALDCLVSQQSVAPFISYRLIQRLVMSNPSPAYVAAVSQVFTSTNGNLQAVVNAILTNNEALAEGTGKLAEPVLYATTLLRALNAADTSSAGINDQATAMGQNAMEPGSVFSYFSPFYRISGVPAPEFQGVNAATSLARANFAWKAVTNGISGTIKVNLTNLQDLATIDLAAPTAPSQLLQAINQGLYRGEMTSDAQSIILAAAKASTSAAANVRSALYAAAAAPQYQVQQ